jgi:AcrR family transcriptional regulator
MGRRAKFEKEALLLAAAREAALGRAPTIQALAAVSGAPVGSIYHRFGSREELLAEAWLLAVRSFQSNFLPALETASTVEDGVAAAVSVPRWSRENPELASLLTLRREVDLLGANTPAPLRRQAATVNKLVRAGLESFAERTGRSLLQCRVAVVGVPYGVVRIFLPQATPPPAVDEMIASAYRAVMAKPTGAS